MSVCVTALCVYEIRGNHFGSLGVGGNEPAFTVGAAPPPPGLFIWQTSLCDLVLILVDGNLFC